MKKYLIIIIIITSFIPFLMRKSDYKDVTKVIYINSVCVDYENDQYVCYFYVLNNFNLAQAEVSSSNIDQLAYVAKIEASSFSDASRKLKELSNVSIHYNHLRSVILTNKFINNSNIKKFYYFIKDDLELYPTFFIFSTDSNPKELFNIENFSEVSAFHTRLINPDEINSYKLVDFLDLSKSIAINNYTLRIPHLSIAKENFSRQDKPYFSLNLDGYTYFKYNNYKKTILEKDIKTLFWIKDLNNTTYTNENFAFYIKSYKIVPKIKQKEIILKLKGSFTKRIDDLSLIENKNKLEKEITDEFKNLINILYNDNIDALNLNYQFNKDVNLNDFSIKVKIDIN